MTPLDATALLEAVPDPLIAAGADGRILGVNPAAELMLAWRASELLGKPLSTVLPRRTAGRVPALRKDGTQIEVDLSLSAPGPLLVALLRPLPGEKPPAGSESELYRMVFENAPVGLFHFDARGVVTAINDAMAQMLGSPNRGLVGINLLTLGGEPGRDRIAELVGEALQGKRVRYEGPYTSMTSGKTIETAAVMAPIHGLSGEVQGGVGIVADMSERKRIQARLARADKMASIGTLAAGVAHEINNPLVYVTLGLELIERELSRMQKAAPLPEDWKRLRAYCADAISGAERVRAIVRDLGTFSRPGEVRPAPVDVEKVLESSINMAMSHILPRAQLVREYGALQPVLADETRLGQVFLNLLVNAAQAIPEGAPEQHRIILKTRAGTSGEAIVEVEDTGVGIESWKLERIFEPFWTDKPVGVGTGLGLSIVHGIVTGLGGEISVRSEPGSGSSFRVVLPSRPRDDAAPAPVGVAPRGAARRPRVLLIDDEPHLGTTLATGLREHADLIAVRSGREAIELLLRDDAFDLILCDLMMPDLTGMDVFEEVSKTRPALRGRFVFTTGGAVTERARQFIEEKPDQRLDKPFRLEQVEALLRRPPR